MSNTTKSNIIAFSAMVLFAIISMSAFRYYSNNNLEIANNGNERDYEFEEYCDYIFKSDPEYFYDVLSELDKYQDYVAKHGAWWEN